MGTIHSPKMSCKQPCCGFANILHFRNALLIHGEFKFNVVRTECAKPTARKSSKASRKKSAKSFLAKKSAKLTELSRAAVGLGTYKDD
jgi:hypothetical protein